MARLSRRIQSLVPSGGDGWALHYRALAMRTEGGPVVMLSIGDHDISTPAPIVDAMKRSMDAGNLGYTSVQGSRALREAVASRITSTSLVSAAPDNVLITTGGQGAIFSAMMAALEPGDSCVVLDPYYASFAITVRSASADPIIVETRPEDGFQPDAEAIEAALRRDTRAILINTPNNPTGAVYSHDRLQALADLCIRRDLWLISDELYDSQVHDGRHLSPRDLPGMAERTFQVGSMSKGFAMTGARIGWVAAPADAIARMAGLAGATTYGLPGFIQDAAVHALNDLADEEARVAARYRRRRDLALGALANGPGFRIVPPQGGMYLMLDVRETGLTGTGFAEALLDEEGIAVMPGESFGRAAAGHIRVALTVADEALGNAMTRLAACAARHAAQAVPTRAHV